jgi:hypothetical protein
MEASSVIAINRMHKNPKMIYKNLQTRIKFKRHNTRTIIPTLAKLVSQERY